MKRFCTFIFVLLISINIEYGISIGLDSGHSIKEIYKSGGYFTTQKKNIDDEGNITIVPAPYYSIGWPAGGVRVNIADNLVSTYVKTLDSLEFPGWKTAPETVA